jgi:hypothetical protein
MQRTPHRHTEPDVAAQAQGAGIGRRWWSLLLDGAHQWGSFDATVGRHGVRRYWLIVYPPASSPADRRLARLWRGWPITGAVLALLAVMLLGNAAASPDTVLGYAVAAYAGIGALLFLRARPACVQARSLSIILMPNRPYGRERVGYVEWLTIVRMLTRADDMLATRAISLVEHEAIWWEAYDRLEAIDV